MRKMYSLLLFPRILRCLPAGRGLLVMAGFALTPLLVTAQQEAIPDSAAIIADSLFEQDAYDETGDEEEEEPDYFLPKAAAGQGMDSLRWRQLPDDAKRSLREDPDFWYANRRFERDIPEKKPAGLTGQSWFQPLLWFFIIAGFIAFVILYLANSNIGLFRRADRQIREESDELVTDDIFAINYQKEIDKASGSGNYRLAIRLLFLRLLKNLSEKNIIQYKPDRTNFDYLMQLNATRYYPDFFRVTRHYEYSWYGKFEISPDTYHRIKEEFESITVS